METFAATRAVEIEREEFSIADKQEWIMASLRRQGSLSFQELLRSLPSRAERVVAFLALLELIRLAKVHAAQRRVTGEILLMISGGEESRA
jgi:segregation and condensation protein A